ncbi:DNA cytosine methyltransferase [Streptomyces sp. NRRL S-1521]|uniref:DNA cytosine methyltransferase n=1 Tax=Streptomyces sp. NRRL S-1521 TaxID=1609100 RepID=UPI00074A936D|nr:DNA cytosine methyltransferase [Streptomyces sp. NRRL S-1521]KUL52294.1 DNA methyltransferase [Streptomyces sp. NRRL S-1521]
MTALRIGSVCTGYGGLDMAVRSVFGGELAWVADNDPGASRILAHRHPGVPNLGDITSVDFARVAPVDVVCGGYPCQPFSTAGKRKGTADARHIWPHIARALGVLRPRYAVFENVAGHLSLGFDSVLADLAALGFDARWCTLRASDVGAAHQRNRLFVLAWPTDRRGRAPADPLDLGEHRPRTRGTGRDEPAPRHLPVADASRVGHGNTWSASERGMAAPTVAGGHSADFDSDHDEPEEQQRRESALRAGRDADRHAAQRWGRYGPAIEAWAQVIGCPAPGPVAAVGRLSPAFVEWLMGLPAGHVTDVPGLSRSAQLKALGNGVVPQQAVAALRFLTLTALPARTAA